MQNSCYANVKGLLKHRCFNAVSTCWRENVHLRPLKIAEASVILLLMTLVLSMYALWIQQKRASAVVYARVLENASVMSAFAQTAHAQYSDSVRQVVSDGQVSLTAADQPATLSLHFPATFSRLMTSRFSTQHPTARFGFYSDVPFEGQRDRVLDEFSEEAISTFDSGSSEAFWRIEPYDSQGLARVRYATPVVMQESCVACHNRPEWGLERSDWQVGDVRGVWEVSLNVPKTDLHSPIETQVLVALNAAACLLGVFLVFPAVRREVEQRAHFENLSIDLGQLAETDALSGLPNRRAFETMMDRVMSSVPLEDRLCGLIVVDIDFFKRINDTHGHDVGDQVIRAVALVLQDSVRPNDFTARIGGEEFAVLAPDVDQTELSGIAHRVRAEIADASIEAGGQVIPVTASVGAALLNRDDDRHSFYRRADRQLYNAKRGGRNQVGLAF